MCLTISVQKTSQVYDKKRKKSSAESQFYHINVGNVDQIRSHVTYPVTLKESFGIKRVQCNS